MRFSKWSGMAMILAILTVSRTAAVSVPRQAPSPETVAKLIGQLGSADFQLRQRASERLEEFGGSVLPALRQAIAAKTEPEVKRRLDLVVTRIENNLRKAEEKCWQDLDTARRGLKDRLVEIVFRTPTLSDRQRASAVYLLAVGRPPTDAEVKRARKQLVETNGRAASALSLARSLVPGEKFCAEVADVNMRLSKLKTDLAAEKELLKKLHRVNTDEVQKLNRELAGSLTKVMKADEPLIDLAFLLVVSRFPDANETEMVLAHLKKAGRQVATEDIIWFLQLTKEFLQPE